MGMNSSPGMVFMTACYATESLVFVEDYPALVYARIKPNADKPLIVFIPGANHLARIAYGSPETDEKDFLAYWCAQMGYPFLAISYPLGHDVFPKAYPEITIRDWAKQAIKIVLTHQDQYQLSNEIILVTWSMGGNITQAFSERAKQQTLKLKLAVGLSAIIPMPNVFDFGDITLDQNHLVDRTDCFVRYMSNIEQQSELNGHEILSKENYLSDFVGNTPLNLMGTEAQFHAGSQTTDPLAAIKDLGAYRYDELPMMANLHDDSLSGEIINLTDTANWRMLRNNMLLSHLKTDLSQDQIAEIHALIRDDSALTKRIHGTHFFFVGEKGAKETVSHIAAFEAYIKALNLPF
jgi:hypothetical protein